jgi:flagellar M-ring protein FliF
VSDALQTALGKARSTMSGFTPGQVGVIAVAIAALIAAGIFFSRWSAAPFAPLYSNLASADAAKVVQELDSTGTAYQLEDGGATILVPQDKVYATRITLSGKGIPSQSQNGYALLDQQGITTSEFMQNVTYQRAVEGELASTIGAIDGVQAATVHLALPAKSVFTQDTDKPTASVMVTLDGGASLTADQVTAITNLVSSSVPKLTSANVTVVDSSGTLLTTGTGAGALGASSQTQVTARTEQQLSTSAQTMLDSVLGVGNSAVRVNAVLDFDQRETKTQSYTYTPGTPPISSQTATETYSGTGSVPGGVVGTGSTTAVSTGTTTTTTPNSYSKSSSTANNAVGSQQETRTGAAGTIKRLTVAVLVNSKAAAGGASPTQISALVANAVGLDTARGDSIQVTPLAFDTSAQATAEAAAAAAADAASKAAMVDIVRKVGIALMVLVVLLLAFLSMRRQRRTAIDDEELAAISYSQSVLLSRDDEARVLEGAVMVDPLEEDTRPRELEAAQAEISELVAKQPDEVAQLLRSWITSGR